LKNLQAITFDFWSTLYRSTHSNNDTRITVLQNAMRDAGLAPLSAVTIEAAIKNSWKAWLKVWEEEHRTWGAVEWLAHLQGILEIQFPTDIKARLLQELEDVILDGNTLPIQGVREMLPVLAEQYRLGIISDTGIASGKTLTKLLVREGLHQYFSCLVYSDEVQRSKPAAEPFQAALKGLAAQPWQAVHVGDLRRTDVAGARNAGMWSIRYTGDQDDSRVEYGEAHVVLADYTNIATALQTIENLAQTCQN
jgi:putative hydrolase of the HAD superfamily